MDPEERAGGSEYRAILPSVSSCTLGSQLNQNKRVRREEGEKQPARLAQAVVINLLFFSRTVPASAPFDLSIGARTSTIPGRVLARISLGPRMFKMQICAPCCVRAGG